MIITIIELVQRVHELNERVEDIQIEQNAQRVSNSSRVLYKSGLNNYLQYRKEKKSSVINLN
jgi:DNA gyrase/topoisomerase IV subunit B